MENERPFSPLTVRLVASEEAFKALESPWNTLLEHSSANTLFLRWEWLFTWWNLFGHRIGQLFIVVVEDHGGIVGIAPCYIKHERFLNVYTTRILQYLGTGEDEAEEIDSEYLSLICRPESEDAVVQSVLDFALPHCDAIRLSKMVLDSTLVSGFRAFCTLRQIRCHIQTTTHASFIPLPKTWDDYLTSLSRAMRYEIRSDRRKLLKHGEVVFRVTSSLKELDSDFETLVHLHRTHWVAEGFSGVFENQIFSHFHKTILPTLLKNGHLELCLLSLAGKPIGAAYHFQYDRKLLFYQTGFDRSVASNVSIGLVTISHCIERAIQLRCTEYDFLGGVYGYKKRLASQSRPIGEISILLRPFLKGFQWLRQTLARAKQKPSSIDSLNDQDSTP